MTSLAPEYGERGSFGNQSYCTALGDAEFGTKLFWRRLSHISCLVCAVLGSSKRVILMNGLRLSVAFMVLDPAHAIGKTNRSPARLHPDFAGTWRGYGAAEAKPEHDG